MEYLVEILIAPLTNPMVIVRCRIADVQIVGTFGAAIPAECAVIVVPVVSILAVSPLY